MIRILLFLVIILNPEWGLGMQAEDRERHFKIIGDKNERITFPFELINNLVVIEAHINGSVPLKFILDSGVGNTLVTSLPSDEEISLNQSRIISLAGLGIDEPVQAYYSESNRINIANVQGENIPIAFLEKDIFKLSSFMGTYVHGIIGYDLLADFALEINYRAKKIHLYQPEAFEDKFEHLKQHRLWYKIPIILNERKPYVNLNFKHSPGDSLTEVRLLIDSGSSNAFSLYQLTHENINIPDNRIKTFIGVGLNGKVTGYIGRVQKMKLKEFEFKEPVVAYPDSLSIRRALYMDSRNGSMGGEVLRRFKVIFHYRDGYMLLRPNRDYNDRFWYNRSGIEVNTPFPNLPLYVVSEVRDESPADIEGVQVGDVIRSVNGEPAARLSLDNMVNYLHKNQSSTLRLEVQRDTLDHYFVIRTPNVLKVDSK